MKSQLKLIVLFVFGNFKLVGQDHLGAIMSEETHIEGTDYPANKWASISPAVMLIQARDRFCQSKANFQNTVQS